MNEPIILLILAVTLLVCCIISVRLMTLPEPEYIEASAGSRYRVILIDSVPYLKGSLGALTPYIKKEK